MNAVIPEKSALQAAYQEWKAKGLKLDMSRGKPCPEQLDLADELLRCETHMAGATDTRNYGLLEGLPEAKALFGEMLGMAPEQIIVGGNSSLNLMYDYIAAAYAKGVCGHEPWARQGAVKFLCPSPGYDRHFSVTEFFGIEMINVPMTEQGPDMDAVERLVRDPLVKGMWCVPMYSNPDGVTYSDDTVRRLAAMTPAAPDFRIMWDDAYCLHHLYDTPDTLLNLYDELKKCGHEDNAVFFASFSKISFPGGGIAALAASPANLADIGKRLFVETIGYDKINMLRHVRFFKDLAGVQAHMAKHAAILRPKFEAVLDILTRELTGFATWHTPRGGYFVSVMLPDGCAKRTVQLLKEAGVVMTGAGASYPYGRDEHDANLRIAPTYPSLAELKDAMELFCICAKLAYAEKAEATR